MRFAKTFSNRRLPTPIRQTNNDYIYVDDTVFGSLAQLQLTLANQLVRFTRLLPLRLVREIFESGVVVVSSAFVLLIYVLEKPPRPFRNTVRHIMTTSIRPTP